MTQKQLAERLNIDQGTVSRWERGAESPRPARRAALQELLMRDDSRRAMLRSIAIVRQDYLPSTLLDNKLRLLEVSKSGERHFRERGLDTNNIIGKDIDSLAARVGNSEFQIRFKETLTQSGLLTGDALLFRFVRNHKGRGHATVYEPIFEGGKLLAILNYVTAYFDLPRIDENSFELIETVRTDDPSKAIVLHRGPHAEDAERALRKA
jgi:transcriptional regulator with XRE-family HTH domain